MTRREQLDNLKEGNFETIPAALRAEALYILASNQFDRKDVNPHSIIDLLTVTQLDKDVLEYGEFFAALIDGAKQLNAGTNPVLLAEVQQERERQKQANAISAETFKNAGRKM